MNQGIIRAAAPAPKPAVDDLRQGGTAAAAAGRRRITWPAGRQFAFTIVDDTDAATVENVAPVYRLLAEYGFRTTKTIWPLAPWQTPRKGGSTLADPRYGQWVRQLQSQGFEIAFHGATDHTAPRDRTLEALNRYRDILSEDPRLYVAHTGQREGMYWGDARLDGGPRLIYRLIHRLIRVDCAYEGHVAHSPYFWGDLCRDRITYVRNFAFRDINTLRHDPMMPYHDPRRPYVRYWFSSSHASTVRDFCELLSEPNQERLLRQHGACIAYVHFGYGFVEKGQLNPEFVRLVRRLAALPGWFVPASSLLDHLRAEPGWQPRVDRHVLDRMQWRWLCWKFRYGRT